MATLVLTTVGGIVGGPIGAAVGGLLGNAVDRSVLSPKGRQGPRLTELAVQTSSYGSPIPKLFGTMRVAGTVVWATDLRETKAKSKAGKGQPTTTTYSYSASFAVLLSARAVVGVGRIWADGTLLRGAGGDLKTATGFRLHLGDEGQPVDPLIAAAEGLPRTPALRGQAYAVFEDLQLADYGNRIPSLTFEVIADDGPVSVGTVAGELGVAGADAGSALGGFSAYGDSVRGVLETLASVDGAWFAVDRDAVVMRAGADQATEVTIADDGYAAAGKRAVRSRRIADAEASPRRVAVAHYDPARDYQAGLQRARRPGAGVREDRIELPAALDAGAARTIADGMLARGAARRERRTITLASDAATIAPGARVRITDDPGQWRVSRWTLEAIVVRLELERIARAPVAASASAGRVLGAPDVVHGPTTLHAFEIPPLDDAVLNAPRLTIAAAGGPGWRQAALLLSLDDGARWTAAGAAQVPATVGTVTQPPGVAGAALLDLRHTVEVVLAHDRMTLDDADDAALDAGLNLALIGDELLQFGHAERVAPDRWRLSRLLRGRRGTEAVAGVQRIGDRFVLLDPETLVTLDLPLAALDATARVLASGVGDRAGPVEADAPVSGASVRPPAPVDISWSPAGDGSGTLRWTRRSRAGWRWLDGGDVPLAEEGERYRVTIGPRTVEIAEPALAVTAADRAAGPTIVSVRQLGTFGASPALSLTI